VTARIDRTFAVAYLAALPMAWGGFVLLMFGYSWAVVLIASGGLGLIATALDVRARDPSILEREQQRRWPLSSSWPVPAGWRTAWSQVLFGREIPHAWATLRGKNADEPPPHVRAKTRRRSARATRR
jgi:hypothetical protein